MTCAVFRCFYVYALCSCSVKVNERQDVKGKTGRNGLLCLPNLPLSQSESPGVTGGPG